MLKSYSLTFFDGSLQTGDRTSRQFPTWFRNDQKSLWNYVEATNIRKVRFHAGLYCGKQSCRTASQLSSSMMSPIRVKGQCRLWRLKSDGRSLVKAFSGISSTGSIRAALKSVQMLSTLSGYVSIPRFLVAGILNDCKDILTRHKNMVAQYLSANFDEFFSRYNTLLIQSDSYVTKRQSVKLLGEILLDRANYNVMTAYVDSGAHLKLCMNLLKDDRKMVQYEGFHVFKVFVANPNKSIAVQRILINNRDRLLKFLPRFLEDRTDDDQFTDEKSFLVRQIELLPAEPVDTRPQPVGGVGVGAVA